MVKPVFVSALLFFPIVANAATIVFLQGAPTGTGRAQDFEFERDVAKETGSSFVSAGWNGTSPATGASLEFPLRTEDDFRSAIRRAVERTEERGDHSIFLSIHSHGAPPLSPDLLNGGIALYPASADWLPKKASHFSAMIGKRSVLSYLKMEQIIREEVPEKLRLKIEMDACFGGSIHQLSFDAPNVCSSSVTDSETTSMENPSAKYSTFDHAFLERFLGAPQSATLYQMHTAAMDADRLNGRRALLSSEAYVDSILGEGSFAPGLLSKYVSENSLGIIAPFLGLEKRFSAAHWWEGACHSDPLEARLAGMAELALSVNRVLEQISLQEGELPAPLRSALSDGLVNLENRLLELLPNLSKLSVKERDEANSLLRERRELLQRAERVTKFLRMATPAQKKKYLSLLSCETEAL